MHCLSEIIDNSVDDALAGFGDHIDIFLNARSRWTTLPDATILVAFQTICDFVCCPGDVQREGMQRRGSEAVYSNHVNHVYRCDYHD